MGALVIFLIGLLAVIVFLAIVLVVAFIQLSRELRRLEGETEALIKRLRSAKQIAKVILPVATLARSFSSSSSKGLERIFKKEKSDERRKKD